VPAVFGRNADEADLYRQLLEDHDIPALIGDDEVLDKVQKDAARRPGMTRGVAVLVPEAMLDEASEVIADREETEGFSLADTDDEFDDEDEEEDEEFGFSETNELGIVGADDEDEEDLLGLEEEDDDDEDEDDEDDDLLGLDDDDDDDLLGLDEDPLGLDEDEDEPF